MAIMIGLSRGMILLAVVLLLVAGCTGPPGAAPATATAVPTTPATVAAAPPISIVGIAKSGASAPFKLQAGSYHVEWSTTPSQASCAFYLFLAAKVNGPTVKDIPIAIMPTAEAQSGSTDWTGVTAGTYVLQEDRSGLASCTGPWDATLTAQ